VSWADGSNDIVLLCIISSMIKSMWTTHSSTEMWNGIGLQIQQHTNAQMASNFKKSAISATATAFAAAHAAADAVSKYDFIASRWGQYGLIGYYRIARNGS
jgi:hypothetical protein